MNVVIVGCGRVGARLATMLDEDGHKVTILDREPYGFQRLPPTFKGVIMVGDGTDEDMQRKASIEKADVFVSVTEGDNKNIMAAQIAKHIFHVPKVICRIYDPIRSDLYRQLGLKAITSTTLMADLIRQAVERP